MPKPPSAKKRPGSLAGLQVPTRAAENLSRPSETLVSFGFRVTPEFHKRYKMIAASTGKPMVDILQESLELWEKENLK